MFIGIGMNVVIGGELAAPASLFAGGEPGVWFDPSDLTTLFQDSAGTTPVTEAGQPVGRMLDKSGRGNHATQSTSASRPTYQVDSTGRAYLSFDGVDDWMVTPTITPGTDKSQVFAGVRKLSDTAANILELSAGIVGNNGSIRLSMTTTQYIFTSKGTVQALAVTTGTITAPITNVLAGIGDIAADRSIIRNNGVIQATTTTDQGTGNYLAYPIYIGSRNGTALLLNGRIYSLIVRFGPNLTTGQITSTESWVNGKTGAY